LDPRLIFLEASASAQSSLPRSYLACASKMSDSEVLSSNENSEAENENGPGKFAGFPFTEEAKLIPYRIQQV